MPRLSLPLLLVIPAALIAGCGGSTPAADQAPQASTPAKATPAPGGELRVGATDRGIGKAVTGGPGGVRVLPSLRVPGISHTQQGVGAGASCENAELMPVAGNTTAVVAATLCLLNGERADAGLGALRENARLADAAIAHSREMVDRQYFDHAGRDGTDPVGRIRSSGYIPKVGTWTVGENLAWGTGTLATPKAIVAAWMKSTGHRENILRPAFTEIGFGVVAGNPRSSSGSGATFTTTFGGVSGTSVPTAKRRRASKARGARARKARAAKARRARASKAKASASARSKRSPKRSGSR